MRGGVMTRVFIGLVAVSLIVAVASAEPLAVVGEQVPAQPLVAHVNQLQEALDYLGTPLPDQVKAALADAAKAGDDAKTSAAVQAALDPLCLFGVDINPE